MANPFYRNNMTNNNPFGNISQLINQFNQFKQTINGNPQQMVQNLLQSGKMSQQQFDYLQGLAKQFQQFLK